MPRTEDAQIALSFKSLAHPRRVRLFRLLADARSPGLGYDALQNATGMRDSTLVHHLRELERTGLVQRQRRGVRVHFTVTPGRFTAAIRDAMAIAAKARGNLAKAA